MATPEEINYINARWIQLNTLSKDATDKAIQFLFLTNSGGAIATLSFIGAVQGIRSQWAPKVALGLFAAGLILVGIHIAYWVHFIDFIFYHWRKDSARYTENQITWATLVNDDNNRAYKTTALYIIGYASFVCFIAGVLIGLLGTTLS
jgi:hypothetical protein